MDFSFSAEEQRLIERAKALAAEFAPRARGYDEAAAFPAEDFARLRDEGFLALTVPRALGGHGLGLTSMRERLKLVDGRLSIDSKVGHGTTVRARVPLGRRPAAEPAT